MISRSWQNELSLASLDSIPNRTQRFEIQNGEKFYFELDGINYAVMVDLDIIQFKKNDYFGCLYMRKWNEFVLGDDGIKVTIVVLMH